MRCYSDSPRSRRIAMSERDMLVSSNPQPVCQFNPITGELVMSSTNVNFNGIAPIVSYKLTDLEKDKVNVGKDKAPKHKASIKNLAAVLYKAQKQKTSVKKPAIVVKKLDAVVDKAPKHKAPAKKPASVVVQDKDNVTVLAKEPASIMNKAADVKEKSDGKGKKFTIDKDNDKDALKNKATDVRKKSVGKGKKSSVDKPKDNAPNPKDNKSKAHSDVVPVAEMPKPNPKQKEKSTVQELSEVPVLRSSNQKVNPDVKSKVVVHVSKSKETPVKRKMIVSKEDDRKKKLKGKSKKEDSNSELKTDDVDSFSDEVDRKRKKLKIKAGLKRKRSGSDSSDSSSINIAKVKRLISKLEKKVKKQESDEESVPKKDQLPSKLGWFVMSKFESYMLSLDTGDKIEVTHQKIHDMLGVHVGRYSLFELDEREADHEFVKLWVVNFLTLFTNTMGKADGLKGKICLDVVRCLRKDSLLYLDSTKFDRFPVVRTRPAIRNWSTYLMRQRQELELKERVVGLLDLNSDWTKTEVKEAEGFIGSVENSMKEVCVLDCLQS
ncbi:hypothetical protein Tco_1302130 [Tanacetum coccineum]